MQNETLVDVGGYRLALYATGSGTPPVILDAGRGAGASVWQAIHAAVGSFTHVVAFDRPGIGRSDPVSVPYTNGQVVEEARRLLSRMAVPPPYILVGHSSGGLNMRMYALQYPHEVAGLVLVDAVHPDQFVRAAALLPPESLHEDAGLHEFRAALHALNHVQAEPAIDHLADKQRMDVGGPGSLGALPLLVLTATEHDLGLPKAVTAPLEQDWLLMQREMLELSTDAVHIIAQGSGHNIHLESPELVVEAIRRVVEAVRRRVPLQKLSA